MNVTKRNGDVVGFDVEKIHKVLEWATEGLNGVSFSDVEMNANLSLYDKIPTSEIHQILIKSANDLISESAPNYQYVAARLLNMQLRKDVWGVGDRSPNFHHFIAVRIDNGVYDPTILEKWSKEDVEPHLTKVYNFNPLEVDNLLALHPSIVTLTENIFPLDIDNLPDTTQADPFGKIMVYQEDNGWILIDPAEVEDFHNLYNCTHWTYTPDLPPQP